MKRLTLALMIVGLLALGGQSFAALCTVDAVPAATLLVPYFEVDLDDPSGVTTLFSINNASAAPALAHVIFWTDWSYPTIDFDVYLTGYDVVSVNVADVFLGIIPITADPQSDPGQTSATTFCGTKSPCGGNTGPTGSFNPQWDNVSFPFCNQIFPNFNNPVIIGTGLSRLRDGHTGIVVPSLGACVGFDHGDNVARGYITIDNVSECSLVLDPADAGLTGTPYFIDGGLGVANNINQLWGDWFLVDPANAFAQGDTLVHIEANDSFNALTIPLLDYNTGALAAVVPNPIGNATGYTFYGRYFAPADGRDNREPLGTIWASRYLNGGAFDQTNLIVWRDSTANDIIPIPNGFAGAWCGSGPSWFQLNETEVIAFNEQEEAVEICFFTGGVTSPPTDEDPACFPLETGRYVVGDAPLDLPFNFGWLYLNLNLPPDNPIGDHDFGPDGNIAQSYVTTTHSALGLFSVGLQAIELYDACQGFNGRLNGALFGGGVNTIPFF